MHETQYQRVFLLISIKKNLSRSHSNRNNLIVYPWGLSFHKSKAKEEALLKVASTRVKYNGKNVANVLVLTLSYNDIIDVSLYNGDRKRTRKSSKDNIVDSKRCTCMQWKKKYWLRIAYFTNEREIQIKKNLTSYKPGFQNWGPSSQIMACNTITSITCWSVNTLV